MTSIDISFMHQSLDLARQAMSEGETPVGAIVCRGTDVLGRGYNRREQSKDPTTHAEILALREASVHMGDWRLEGCTLYVTLEPCAMCVGACLMARIDRIVFGAPEPKWGALGSRVNLLQDSPFPHKIQVTASVLAEDSAALLKDFFATLRSQKKNAP
jgi:tRNA(adenine34) deaminase